jgi:FixJ family two-component response regulator
MPIMNGVELVHFIQTHFVDLPVFIMTGDVECVDLETKNSNCVKKIFQKPFNLSDLENFILPIAKNMEIIS